MQDLETQFANYSTVLEILSIAGLTFLFFIVVETLWDKYTGKRETLGETTANFVIGAGNVLLENTIIGVVFVAALYLATPFALFEIPITWFSWILAVIVADFTYYWMHRWEHEIRILWANHIIHHSSIEFNFTTALRVAWVDSLIEWIFFIPMILLGFDLVQTVIALLLVISYQNWIHTEKIYKLGWLDKIFNTPSVHRVHHGSNEKYIDKNYGGILIIWDRIFGTYQQEEEAVVYGIVEPLNSANPLIINFHEYWKIIKDVRKSNSLKDAMGYILGRPGWKP